MGSAGTVVTVTGRAFDSAAACAFGTVPATAVTVDSSSQVRCAAPAQGATRVAVEVTNNAQDYSYDGHAFTYYTLAVTSVAPTNGPLAGGTRVTVTGGTFLDSPALRCQFGTFAAAAATYHSPQAIVCAAPSSAVATTVALEVSNNQQDYTTSGVPFALVADATVSSTTPTAAPARTPPCCFALLCAPTEGIDVVYARVCCWR